MNYELSLCNPFDTQRQFYFYLYMFLYDPICSEFFYAFGYSCSSDGLWFTFLQLAKRAEYWVNELGLDNMYAHLDT